MITLILIGLIFWKKWGIYKILLEILVIMLLVDGFIFCFSE